MLFDGFRVSGLFLRLSLIPLFTPKGIGVRENLEKIKKTYLYETCFLMVSGTLAFFCDFLSSRCSPLRG